MKMGYVRKGMFGCLNHNQIKNYFLSKFAFRKTSAYNFPVKTIPKQLQNLKHLLLLTLWTVAEKDKIENKNVIGAYRPVSSDAQKLKITKNLSDAFLFLTICWQI